MLNDFERTLAQLYDNSAKARHVIDRAGISAERVNLDGAMRDVWHSIVAEAIRDVRVLRLLEIALEDYPQRTELHEFRGYWRSQWRAGWRNQTNNEDTMGERWSYPDHDRLRERITVLETKMPALQDEMKRRFDELQAGQNNNRSYSEKEFGEMRTLIKAITPVQPVSEKLTWAVMTIGGLVTLTLLVLIFYIWSQGRLL